ncbi:hypothetical protein AU196_14575 [Mycobacterium sp. IS-1742]|nr:hypothetical protein AU196_14575 [Mycobacterium sp. IS-1742]
MRGSVLVPALLAIAIAVVFMWGFHITGQFDVETGDHSSSSNWQRLWATLALFTGAYISLNPDWDPMPPRELSVVGIIALSLTLITAGSLVLLSRRVRDFVRTIRPARRLVVIGDGSSAAMLVTSSIDRGIPAVLLTDTRRSLAARAAEPTVPIIASGEMPSALTSFPARRAVKRARTVVIATDSDRSNMALHTEMRRVRTSGRASSAGRQPALGRQPRDLVVIHDSEYAELLRPESLGRVLPANEITCPAENIAEHVCHVIVAAVTGSKTEHVSVAVIDVESPSARSDPQLNLDRTIDIWVRRLCRSLEFLRIPRDGVGLADHTTVPRVTVVCGDPPTPSGAGMRIKIVTGATSAAVVRHVLTNRAAADLWIAIADADMTKGAVELRYREEERPDVLTGREWLGSPTMKSPTTSDRELPILVLDPADVGLDATLVTDVTGTQWARTFDLAYQIMFSVGGVGSPVTGWQPGAPMGESTRGLERERIRAARRCNGSAEDAARSARREIASRYSSKRAAEVMLEVLADRGFELRRALDTNAIEAPPLTSEDIEYIAESEHHDWLTRTWTDTSRWPARVERVITYSTSRANQYCYRGLVALEASGETPVRLRKAADYNRRIATETYPAIAASFGYAIVRTSAPESDRHREFACAIQNCPCGPVVRV